MSDKFDQLFEEARDSGKVDEEWLDRFRNSFEASGLRTDLKDTKDKYAKAMEQNRQYRTGLLSTQFQSLGISISPKALNIPDDLDPTDPDKVQTWAADMGLVEIAPTTPPEERATHDRIANASSDGGQAGTLTSNDLLNIDDEEEFYRKAAAIEASRGR